MTGDAPDLGGGLTLPPPQAAIAAAAQTLTAARATPRDLTRAARHGKVRDRTADC